MDEMTFGVLPHFRAGSLSPRLTPGQGAGEPSLQLLSGWVQLWVLGMNSEIPVGFVRADYSQPRNDIHSTGLSRNLPAAGVSLSLRPLSNTERLQADAWREEAQRGCRWTPRKVGGTCLLGSRVLGPSPVVTRGTLLLSLFFWPPLPALLPPPLTRQWRELHPDMTTLEERESGQQ